MIFQTMKTYFLFLVLTASCQVTETLYINPDGNGNIEVVNLRAKKIYKGTTYIFWRLYQEIFSRTPTADQKVFLKYSEVKVYKKKSSCEKGFRRSYSQNFKKVMDIIDFYKIDDYEDDIRHSMP
jgi:hypothetical protein